ncbi:MAG: ABC transporter ATP-binding protein, partial [Gemmatimonadetes bacterium]|nr:ABC transporter ATP-binding protein [Gemmatimonadota bacterium]
ENLSGIRVVKAYTQEPAQNAAFDQLNLAYLEKNRAYILTRANYRPLSYVIASLCLGLNLWLGGRAVIDGELSLGAFVAFNAYLTQLIRPIMYIGWVIDRAQRALVSMQRINEILAVEPEIQDRALGLNSGVRRAQPSRRSLPPATPQPIAGHIAFRKLNFSYGEEQVLHQIDLEIPQGTTLGIIGRVGSGKTTLARLVPRLIQAGPGQLLIDGVPIEEWPLATLRDAIGYVPQNPFLFSNTLSANLAYGADAAEEAQIHAVAEEAQLKKDIDQFDEGFDTLIGERGVTLSGGQKQRATLARALIRRPQILILDDALSAVDTHTEEAILDHLHALMQGRTTLIIAHRISTLRHTDRVAVLKDGRIAELGTHADLVNSGGFYAELYQHQQLSAELETL